ncbi:hypothetical protein N2152v2_005166 [Parachlorella kessleri]
MATVERVPTNGTERVGRDKAVSQGEFHGIPLGQNGPQVPVEHGHRRVEAFEVEGPPVTQGRVEGPGSVGMVGTPIITREAHTGATTTAMAGGSPPVGRLGRMQREGSAGRLSSSAATPRSVGSLSAGGGRLRGIARSPHAPGMQTFGQKYLPFAAGFAYMAETAPVYRSTSLGPVGPTAAATEDMSYYYRLDSGKIEPGAHGEHVRNTKAASRSSTGKGGLWSRFGGLSKDVSDGRVGGLLNVTRGQAASGGWRGPRVRNPEDLGDAWDESALQ